MKKDVSSLELHYLIKEFEPLVGGKVEQVYQIGRDEMIIQFHVPSLGKRIMRFILGKMVYLASSKPIVPETPPGFCLFLRKRLGNSRLRSISQLGFERIVELCFETKDAKFKLVVELFGTGNIALCDDSSIILSVLEQQEWKDRSLKPKNKYVYPKKEFNVLDMSRDSLRLMLVKSDKESLVKALAIELGLGGIYSEEVCLLSKVDKNLKPGHLSDKELDDVFSALTAVLSAEISAKVIFDDASCSSVKDVAPFALSSQAAFPSKDAASFNEALDSVMTVKKAADEIHTSTSAAKSKLAKIEEIISQQQRRIAGLEISAADNQRKGEMIYENYPLVDQILKEVNEIRKKQSWQAVKESFKSHKLVRKIDDKIGEISVDL